MLPLVFLNMCFSMEIARVFEAIANAPASFFPGLLDDRGVIAVFARLCFESIVLNARFLELTYNSIYAAPRSASATPAVKASPPTKASPLAKTPATPKATKAPPATPKARVVVTTPGPSTHPCRKHIAHYLGVCPVGSTTPAPPCDRNPCRFLHHDYTRLSDASVEKHLRGSFSDAHVDNVLLPCLKALPSQGGVRGVFTP